MKKPKAQFSVGVVEGGVNVGIVRPFLMNGYPGEQYQWKGFTPRQARALASALLKAADKVDRKSRGRRR